MIESCREHRWVDLIDSPQVTYSRSDPAYGEELARIAADFQQHLHGTGN